MKGVGLAALAPSAWPCPLPCPLAPAHGSVCVPDGAEGGEGTQHVLVRVLVNKGVSRLGIYRRE